MRTPTASQPAPHRQTHFPSLVILLSFSSLPIFHLPSLQTTVKGAQGIGTIVIVACLRVLLSPQKTIMGILNPCNVLTIQFMSWIQAAVYKIQNLYFNPPTIVASCKRTYPSASCSPVSRQSLHVPNSFDLLLAEPPAEGGAPQLHARFSLRLPGRAPLCAAATAPERP